MPKVDNRDERNDKMKPISSTRKCKVCRVIKNAQNDFGNMHNYEVEGGYSDKTCKACRLKIRRARKAAGINKMSKMYKCIADPSGIYLGSHFYWGQLRLSLADGNITPGTVWLDRKTGIKYRIVGNEAYHALHDCLRDISKIPDDIREKQRRVIVR